MFARVRILLTSLALCAAACGGSDGSSSTPEQIAFEPAETATQGMSITGEGGAVTVPTAAGDVVVTVARGAAAEPIELTVTPFSTDLAGFTRGVALGPDGTHFQGPVEVRFVGGATASKWAFGTAGDGTDPHLELARVDGEDLVVTVFHFSNVGEGDGALPTFAPRFAETQAKDAIARALRASPVDDAAIQAALTSWLADVSFLIEEAVGNPSRFLEAISAWETFLTATQEIDQTVVAPIKPMITALEPRMARAAKLRVRDLNLKAIERDDWEVIKEIALLFPHMEEAGIALAEFGTDFGTLSREAALRPVIDALEFEKNEDNGHYTVRGRVGFTVAGGVIHRDPALGVDANLVDGTFPGGAQTLDATQISVDGDGVFTLDVRPTADEFHLVIGATFPPAILEPLFFSTSRVSHTTNDGTKQLFVTAYRADGDDPPSSDFSCKLDEVVVVRATVFNGTALMPDVPVTLTLDGPGTLDATTVTTGGEGFGEANYTAPHDLGTTRVRAEATIGGQVLTATGLITTTGVILEIDPDVAIVDTGREVEFTAQLRGSTAGVTWAVSGGGSIDASGLFTAGDEPGRYTVVARSIQDPFAVAVGEVEVLAAPAGLPDDVVETSGTFTMSFRESSSVDTPDESGDPELTDNQTTMVDASATIAVSSCRFEPTETSSGNHGGCTGTFTSSSWSSRSVIVDRRRGAGGVGVETVRTETSCMPISGGGGGGGSPISFGTFFVDDTGHAYLQVLRPGFLLECTTLRTAADGSMTTEGPVFPSRQMGNRVASPFSVAVEEPYFDMHMLRNGAMVGGGSDFSGTFPATWDLRPVAP